LKPSLLRLGGNSAPDLTCLTIRGLHIPRQCPFRRDDVEKAHRGLPGSLTLQPARRELIGIGRDPDVTRRDVGRLWWYYKWRSLVIAPQKAFAFRRELVTGVFALLKKDQKNLSNTEK